ncbi:MAG TPA: hypothetical protein ENJ08_16405 [Gammaproteobacteria bacterium]|nr:hypothetical protein [Gammaproteobacteria bacterium]
MYKKVSETQNRHQRVSADSAKPSGVLPEHLRQQYLSAMDIQVWYDPVLPVDSAPENTLQEAPRVDDTITDNNSGELPKAGSAVGRAEKPSPEASSSEQRPVTEPVPESESEVGQSINSLSELAVRIEQCRLCELHASRKQTVSGEGNANASLMIVTDAPVDDVLYSAENKAMLQQMLQAINVDISDVYLTSLVKCPTPGRREPQTTEMICCDDHLSLQVKLIQPKVILVSGELAAQQLLVSQKSLADLRLRQYQYQGIPVYASFHAQALYDSSVTKRKVWQDLLQLKKIMNT